MKTTFAFFFILLSLTTSASAPKLIEVVKFINHTGAELKRNQAAILKIEETIAGQCFEKEWLSRKLIQTGGKTNQEILSHFRSLKTILALKMYKSRLSSSVGYRNVGSTTINMNRKFHNGMGPCDAGSNIGHEWVHVLGYGHDKKPSKSRADSVPYATGKTIEKCCRD